MVDLPLSPEPGVGVSFHQPRADYRCSPSKRILHSRRSRRESSSSLRSMAWLRFFCSTSSLLVLMQIPMVAAVQSGSRPQAMERVGLGQWASTRLSASQGSRLEAAAAGRDVVSGGRPRDGAAMQRCSSGVDASVGSIRQRARSRQRGAQRGRAQVVAASVVGGSSRGRTAAGESAGIVGEACCCWSRRVDTRAGREYGAPRRPVRAAHLARQLLVAARTRH